MNDEHLPVLRFLARAYFDAQELRKGIGNRIFQIESRDRLSDADLLLVPKEGTKELEQRLDSALKKALKRYSPELYEWATTTKGLSPHGIGLLLGEIGHPLYAVPSEYVENPDFDPDEPSSVKNPKRILVQGEPYVRSVSQLWSYCGYGDPERKKRKGELANWSHRAKSLLFTISSGALMNRRHGGSYVEMYDMAREKYATRDWTDGHRHKAALRYVSKQILKDLYNKVVEIENAHDLVYTRTEPQEEAA